MKSERITLIDRNVKTVTAGNEGFEIPIYTIAGGSNLSFEMLLNALCEESEDAKIRKIHCKIEAVISGTGANLMYLPQLMAGIVAVGTANPPDKAGVDVSLSMGSATQITTILDLALGNEYLFKELARSSVPVLRNEKSDQSLVNLTYELEWDYVVPQETVGLFEDDEEETDAGLNSYPVVWGIIPLNDTTASVVYLTARFDIDYELESSNQGGSRLLTED